jgi:hypothetical protein
VGKWVNQDETEVQSAKSTTAVHFAARGRTRKVRAQRRREEIIDNKQSRIEAAPLEGRIRVILKSSEWMKRPVLRAQDMRGRFTKGRIPNKDALHGWR